MSARIAYLTGGNAWLFAALIAVTIGVAFLVLGPVRQTFGSIQTEISLRQAEISSFKQRRAELRPVTPPELEFAQWYSDQVLTHITRLRGNSNADLIHELSRLADEAGTSLLHVRPLSTRNNAARAEPLRKLELRSVKAESLAKLEPRTIYIELEADMESLAKLLTLLSEPTRPLQLQHLKIERQGRRLHASIDAVYFVREDRA